MDGFRKFILRGNVVDLAVGVIIGAAFGKIVDSLVADLIMPVIAALIGRLDFSNLFVVLGSVPPGTQIRIGESAGHDGSDALVVATQAAGPPE